MDEDTWTPVLDQGPGGAALTGALADPRAILLRLILPGTAGALPPHQHPVSRGGRRVALRAVITRTTVSTSAS